MIESLAQCGGEGERTKSNRTVSRCGYSAVISVATAYDAGPTVYFPPRRPGNGSTVIISANV